VASEESLRSSCGGCCGRALPCLRPRSSNGGVVASEESLLSSCGGCGRALPCLRPRSCCGGGM
jgi:hypothetical protein